MSKISDNLGIFLQDNPQIPFTHLQIGFLGCLILFCLTTAISASKKSFFDAVTARNITRLLRLYITLEYALNIFLLVMVVNFGAPIPAPSQWTSYNIGNGESWTYGYGRPLCGLLFIGLGGVGDMHPLARYICLLASIAQLTCDSFSAYQVHAYMDQVNHHDAPLYNYNIDLMKSYYWRDIISFSLCMSIVVNMLYLIIITGFFNPPLVSYQKIDGQDLDRVSMMHKQAYKHLDNYYLDSKLGNNKMKQKPRATKKAVNARVLPSNTRSNTSSDGNDNINLEEGFANNNINNSDINTNNNGNSMDVDV